MTDEQARQDIAFIRRAIEEGGAYATACSPDMLVWGVAVAIGYLAMYGRIRGWLPIAPSVSWVACIGLPWLYSLRRQLRRLVGAAPPGRGPMARALAMLWLGCGVLLTTLAIAAVWSGDIREGWFDAVVAGVLGTAFFASSWLANLPFLRWVAIAWWIGEIAIFASRRHAQMPLLSAVLMLVLLAGPGLFLLTRGGRLRP